MYVHIIIFPFRYFFIFRAARLQRYALLEVWKTFEEKHGTSDDIAKVQGMMPIVSKKRHVDEETGQVVEGEI